MSERLLLRLGTSAEQPVYWLHWDETQQRTLAQGRLGALAELGQLSALAIRVPCYALVSNAAVLTTQAQLPNASRAARDAIPYQLEEQLADEIENLHFATGKALQPGCYPVAVVAKTLMQLWQQSFVEAGMPIRALLVDAQTIAVQPEQVQALRLLDQTLIRHPDGRSFSFANDQAEQWLTLAADQLGQSSVPIQTSDTGLASLARCFAPDTAIDLLQGPYQLKDPLKQLLRAWKLPALLLGLVLALQGGQLLWQQQQLSQQQQQLEQQINALFSNTLPGSRRVNPQAQFDTELQQLRQFNQGSDFLLLLQRALPAFRSDKRINIDAMIYQAQTRTLTLELEASNHTALERFVAQLQQQGLAVQIQRSRQQHGQLGAQLSIKGEP